MNSSHSPLADRARPLTFDDMVGQEHLCGPNGILRRIAASGHMPSMIFFGPPGCGKTTVAQLISSITGLPLITARLDGLVSSLLGSTAKNIRKIFDYASKRECILFLDDLML